GRAGGASGPADGGRCDERRHPHPIGHRAGRPPGGRAAPASGLRRAAQGGRRPVGPRGPGPVPPGDGPGARGLPAARRPGSRPALRRPRPLLRCGGRGHAPHPHRPRPRPQAAEARRRVRIDLDALLVEPPGDDLLALDEALTALAREDPGAAELVKLRAFAGLPLAHAAEVLGIGRRTADRDWAYARAWLSHALAGPDRPE